jgi:hypothetical protein
MQVLQKSVIGKIDQGARACLGKISPARAAAAFAFLSPSARSLKSIHRIRRTTISKCHRAKPCRVPHLSNTACSLSWRCNLSE